MITVIVNKCRESKKRFSKYFVFDTDFSVFYFSYVGCDNFVSMDGIWKLRHPHCLYPVKAVVSGLPTVNYPSVCTEEPETQASAFCAAHSQLAKEKNVPTNLRQFIHDYCRVPRSSDGILVAFFFISTLTITVIIILIIGLLLFFGHLSSRSQNTNCSDVKAYETSSICMYLFIYLFIYIS